MITAHACIPCLTRQIVDSVDRLTTGDTQRGTLLLQSCLHQLADADFSQPPPAVAQRVQRHMRRVGGNDPFMALKQETRQWALDLLPDLQRELARSEDALQLAVRFAAAGNLIDAGAVHELGRPALEQALFASRDAILDQASIERLRQRIASAKQILYLADNAGELVFDRLLLGQLPGSRVTLVVRGAPVLNDVTREDVAPSGIPADIAVIDNGSDAPGTLLPDCSDEMRRAFDESDLIISKGQGNYETLQDVNAPIFCILTVKCPLVSTLLDQPVGSLAARFL